VASQIVFATGNSAKLAQLRYVIEHYDLGLTVVSAVSLFGDAGRYAEAGSSAAEIAGDGAAAVAGRVGCPILAEDTTFEVDALDGRPGVSAGAYLKEHGRRGILRALQGQQNRQAWITSAVAYAVPDAEPIIWSRRLSGRVSMQERWSPGLPDWVAPSPGEPMGGGYNAIFTATGETRTLAEIPPDEALRLGYREPLFHAFLSWLVRSR
jgi:XTP/dITP diphosphohydrolase